MSDPDVVLASVGSRRAPTLFKLRTWKGLRFLDVRKHFHEEDHLQPTRKGISLRSNGVSALREVLDTHGEEIATFLEGRYDLEELMVSSRVSEEMAAVEELRFGRRDLRTEQSREGRMGMFTVRSSGGTDTVTLNLDHPFVGAKASDASVEEALSTLLAAFTRACELLTSDEDEAELFAELQYTWARILRSYSPKT
jgi:hypothetical protein